MERINTLKRLSSLFYPEYHLDFTDDRTLLIDLFKKINDFSPVFIDIMKDYLIFASENEIYDCLLNSMFESLQENPQTVNPTLINLFKWIYVDSYGKISENNLESILQIINKLEIILLGILDKATLESIDHMRCYEIVDLLIQNLFDIFNKFSVCKNLSIVKIYNQFRLLKLLKISSMIMKLNSFESYGEVIKQLVFVPAAIDGCSSLGFSGELFSISPLLKQMFVDIDVSSRSTDSRKRICLLMKLLLIIFDWIGNNIDAPDHHSVCSDILLVLNTNIRYLNTQVPVSTIWILVFLKDDSKLIKFLCCARTIEEKCEGAFIGCVELLDELFLAVGYDCELLWHWISEYEDLGVVFIDYLHNWNPATTRLDHDADGDQTNQTVMQMFIQIHHKFQTSNHLSTDFQAVLQNFIRANQNKFYKSFQ